VATAGSPASFTSVSWDDRCVPWGYKKEKPSRGVAIAKSRLPSISTDSVTTLIFSLSG
jgi:hypothetical protein